MTNEIASGREARNVDQLIVASQNQTQTPQPVEPSHEDVPHETTPEPIPEQASPETSDPYNLKQQTQPAQEQQQQSANTKGSEEASPIDEYGNPTEKPRLYTEEELNQRIRERLSRGRYAREAEQQPYQQQQQQQYTPQQVQQAQADGFQHDPNSEESWDQQLTRFVNQVVDQREKERIEQQWRHQELQRQSEFEHKFQSSMEKYADFRQVVAGKPINDTMLLATRHLNDPAAFVYAASKLHPQELERIARIEDRYAQAAEVGRLHERMVKDRKSVTSAPRPLNTPTGDIPGRVATHQPSIDQRIHDYAKQKRK